jgi:hypothetical protein
MRPGPVARRGQARGVGASGPTRRLTAAGATTATRNNIRKVTGHAAAGHLAHCRRSTAPTTGGPVAGPATATPAEPPSTAVVHLARTSRAAHGHL